MKDRLFDKKKFHWKPGGVIIFDDTYEHEVHNNTAETRVVLLIDFARPLPREFANKNKNILEFFQRSEFVKDPKSRYEKWENKHLVPLAGNHEI